MLFYASPDPVRDDARCPRPTSSVYVMSPIAAVLTPDAPRRDRSDGARPRRRWPAAPSGCSIPGGIVVGSFVLGLWVFRREAPKIAENL